MNKLKQYLTLATFEPMETPFLHVDPATRFGYVADAEGNPQRIDSKHTRVAVPTYDWQVEGVDEDEPIAKVLQEAAMQSPLKLPNPSTIGRDFWVRNNRHTKVLLIHPSLYGKFLVAAGISIFKSDLLEPDRITCLGNAQFAGYYIKHGNRRGVLAHDKKGLRSFQFGSVG